MPDILFDKLAFKDKLTAGGIPEGAARAHADALDEALREAVVTKPFLRAELTQLRTELAQLETRLTIRVGAMWAAAVGVLALIKFFA